jgi:3-oxoadipate enol-lactonase
VDEHRGDGLCAERTLESGDARVTALHERAGMAAGSPEIRWFSAGSRGPAVLLVMGLGMRGELWRPQVEGLRGAHRLAWFDHRGVGESGPTPSRRLHMRDMARDALRVADALGAEARAAGDHVGAWERFHLVGVSMGGMVAQELALRAPGRVRSLTLIATFGGGPLHGRLPTAEGLRAFVAANVAREPGARVRALQSLLYPPEYLAAADREALGARMRAQLTGRVPPRTLLGQLHAVFRHDTLARLPSLALPTLVVRPGRDVLVRPTHSDALLARLPNARHLALPDAGHGVIFQRAREVNAAVASLIADVERAGA